MTALFLDASVLIARADTEDPEHDASRLLLAADTSIATLDLAFYEVTNVAVRWHDPAAARSLRTWVAAIARDGELMRIDETLVAAAADLAQEHGLSAYDAAYVAGAAAVGAPLVSCDVRDLVRPGHALSPTQALAT